MANKRILLTDDEPDLVEILEAVIERPNWDIITTNDGESTMEKLREESFDLVILDLLMPEPDGFAILKWIRKTKETKDTPVVIISAYCHDSTIKTVKDLGANDFVKKPIGIHEFKQIISKYI